MSCIPVRPGSAHRLRCGLLLLGLLATTGCFAPLHSPGIPANSLPEYYRLPIRTAGPPLNFARLTMDPPVDYVLGPNDVLDVTVAGLFERSESNPLRVTVMADGTIHLPLVGPVRVGGKNLVQAQTAIVVALADGFLEEPRVNVVLAQKSTVNVLVLGQVNQPGIHALPKYENDVGHALGAALGLAEDAADYVEVHRKSQYPMLEPHAGAPHAPHMLQPASYGPPHAGQPHAVPFSDVPVEWHSGILRIPLRGAEADLLDPQQVILGPGDVVVVPNRRHEVFYVVGKLSSTNTVRFTVGDRERELGVGFVLPRDREIDVVTAVAMAGYIDPIDSPTTVTVHRQMPDGCPMLINVDLIKARYDRSETILVQPGDIIYLNPDGAWWFRRTLDRIIGELFIVPFTDLF